MLNQRRGEVDNGVISTSKATIGDLLNLYLADKKGHPRATAPRGTYVRYTCDATAFGQVGGAATPHTNSISNFVEGQKRALGRANASINRWLEGLHRAFTLGYDHRPRLVPEIPKIPMLDESDNVREGLLCHADYVKLRDELPAHQKLILVIGYHFGMRSGEILALQWAQIDWQANLIRLEKRQTKSKQARVAPLYGELRAWLEMAYADPDRGATIVSWKGEKISETKTSRKKACCAYPKLTLVFLSTTCAAQRFRT